MDNTENRRPRRSSPMNEAQLLMEHYTRSIDEVGSEAGNEKIIQKIKEKNRRRGQSIWTDEPVLKPEKSVWLDDEPSPEETVQSTADDENIGQRPVGAVQEKKLIDKPKTELTLEVSQSGERRITSSSKRTVMLELGKQPPRREPRVKLDIQEKQFENRRPTRREISLSLPSAEGEAPVITEAVPMKKAPRKTAAAPKIQPAERSKQASRQEISIAAPTVSVRPAAQPVPAQPQEKTVTAEPPVRNAPSRSAEPAPAERPVKKAVAAREEKAAKELQKELEKYERLREETIKKQRERERLSKIGRNDFEFSFVNAAVCLTVLFVAALALALINRDPSGFPKISVQGWFSGEFAQKTDSYYNEGLPYRDKLAGAGERFSALFGIDSVRNADNKSPAEKSVKKSPENEDGPKDDISESRAEQKSGGAASESSSKEEKVIVFGEGNDVRAVEGYYGSAEDGRAYARAVNAWAEELGDYIDVYSMLIPSSAAYYLTEDKQDSFSDQKEVINAANESLEGVRAADIYDTLDEHCDEYIYSRTDNRWQPLGAYYAAGVFSETAGADFPDISDYDEWRIEGFVGSLYSESGYDPRLGAAPDTFIYHKPDIAPSVTYYNAQYEEPSYGELFFDSAEGANCFSAILGSDTQPCRIDTDSGSGRTLVIFKDGFGNALAPYLTHGFSRIYVCDIRYIDVNGADFCRNVGCTDVLFAVSLPTVSSGGAAQLLDEIRTK